MANRRQPVLERMGSADRAEWYASLVFKLWIDAVDPGCFQVASLAKIKKARESSTSESRTVLFDLERTARQCPTISGVEMGCGR